MPIVSIIFIPRFRSGSFPPFQGSLHINQTADFAQKATTLCSLFVDYILVLVCGRNSHFKIMVALYAAMLTQNKTRHSTSTDEACQTVNNSAITSTDEMKPEYHNSLSRAVL